MTFKYYNFKEIRALHKGRLAQYVFYNKTKQNKKECEDIEHFVSQESGLKCFNRKAFIGENLLNFEHLNFLSRTRKKSQVHGRCNQSLRIRNET